jgi:aspartyl protease family protein
MRQVFVLVLFLHLVGPAAAGSATLTRAEDGHWWAETKVNGRPIQMLVDTGASSVALTLADARKAGIDVANLKFNVRMRTANGVALGADVMLERLDLGTVRVRDVPAVVMQKGLSTSLLGMSWLSRMDRFQVEGQELRLRN